MIWNYHDDDVAGPDVPIKLSVQDLPSGAQRVSRKHYRIDATRSNAYSMWKNMGSLQKVTEEQYRQLEAAGQL